MVDRSLKIWCGAAAAMEIAKLERVKWADVTGKRRHRKIVAVRRRIALKLRDMKLSFPEIGRVLNRDHATVINLVRKRSR